MRVVPLNLLKNPLQNKAPHAKPFSESEEKIIDMEIERLQQRKVIMQTTHSVGEFISTIFIRCKKDGGHRLILNLRKLNKKVEKHHFKMQTFTSALTLITKDCYMASIDWKDAYYSVPVLPEYQKYLRFQWKGQLFQYTCLPNGLSSAPRIFTKITKPIFSVLRRKGHLNSSYTDDSLVIGDTLTECRENVMDTVELALKVAPYR